MREVTKLHVLKHKTVGMTNIAMINVQIGREAKELGRLAKQHGEMSPELLDQLWKQVRRDTGY